LADSGKKIENSFKLPPQFWRVCPFWSNSSERWKNKSLFFKKGEERGVFPKKWR